MFKKKRIIQFDCDFTIESLEEIPIKATDVSAHWSFKENNSIFKQKVIEGKTEGKHIQNNRVVWMQGFKIPTSMFVNPKSNELEPRYLQIQIFSRKTIHSPTADNLGKVFINLQDFSQTGKTTKSFLLRDSKLNSTLKMTIELIQLSGDPFFRSSSPNVLKDSHNNDWIATKEDQDDEFINSQNLLDQVFDQTSSTTPKSPKKLNITPQPNKDDSPSEKDDQLSKLIDDLIKDNKEN
eukprot:gene1702-471_t